MADWPNFNTKAWLRLACCGDEHPTRVEDVTDKGECVIAAPHAPHPDPVPVHHAEKGFFIGWVEGTKALETEVGLVSSTTEPIPTWTIKSLGAITEVTRRRYVRVDYKAEVKLYLLEGGAPVNVLTKDVSEGGFSCEVDQWANDPRGKVFDTEITLDGHYVIKAQVAWWGRMSDTNRRMIGVQFVDISSKTADQVRSFVFSEQLRQRRAVR